jgi:hypothetical protein
MLLLHGVVKVELQVSAQALSEYMPKENLGAYILKEYRAAHNPGCRTSRASSHWCPPA